MYDDINEQKSANGNNENNYAIISGVVNGEPVITHEKSGENFYEFPILVQRNSGVSDIIPICVSERFFLLKIDEGPDIYKLPKPGENFAAEGQFRSYNKFNEISRKNSLILSCFVRRLLTESECAVNTNLLKLVGYICKPPIYRSTPFNREICDILLAVNRSFDKSDYIPCIAWGRNAKFVSHLRVGTKLELEGRIQSRNYQKTEPGTDLLIQKTAFEVSIAAVKTLEGMSEKNIL